MIMGVTAILAMFLDSLCGDPKSKLHPVVLIGDLITKLDKLLRKANDAPKLQVIKGGILVCVVLFVTYGLVQLLLALVPNNTLSWILVNAVVLYFTISPRSLAEAGLEIKKYLLAGELVSARHKVGWIVGRDTANLDTAEVTRATVETIAENTVDGVISPLFYFCIGGAPLAMLYRAVNTMDSMIAYKNEKYNFFGRIAAYTDDVFNYLPARITGILIVIIAMFLRLDYKGAWQMLKRDAKMHPSPNGGWSEAAVAGALGVQLGGLNYYFGIPHLRARMGEPYKRLAPHHITQTIQVMYGVTMLFLILSLLIIYIGGRFI